MAYKILTSPDSEEDMDRAIKRYAEIKPSLAKQFTTELKAVRKYISKNPKSVQIRYKNTRIAYLKIFPYGLHYKFLNETIYITSLYNTSENPKKWGNRT